MRNFERDYRYLLQNLIPLNRLLPARRRKIDAALHTGTDTDVRREAVLALEELVGSSYLRREDPVIEEGIVSIKYSKTSGAYRFLIHIPQDEWKSLAAALSYEEPFKEDEVSKLIRRQREVKKATVEVFPEVLRSFSVSEKNGSLLRKLSNLIHHLKTWLRFHAVKLYIVEERSGEPSFENDVILSLPSEQFEGSQSGSELMRREASGKAILVQKGFTGEANSSNGSKMALAPVFVMGEFWGILEVSSDDLEFELETSASLLTAVRIVEQMIENNIRLENLISVDKLTGVYNRHFYDMQIPIEIERATRAGNKLSMILLDIDDFKRINDELGHKKGDEALVIVADLIRRNLRKIDLPFRYGGEEFVILLPGTAQLEAIHTAERLRSKISEYLHFRSAKGDTRRITVSIGIAVFPDSAMNGEELFIQADKAMFRAKRLGKNRIELYKR